MIFRRGSVSSWYAILPFTFMFCAAVLTSGCGGGGSSASGGTGGGGGTNPPPSTANEWTWMSGSSTVNHPSVYGAKGVASASNTLGARYGALSWTDSSGNFWLYGGGGFDSTGTYGDLSDLWEFNPATKEWTWVNGADAPNNSAVYAPNLFTSCAEGVASASNTPGLRASAVGWTDTSGNLWLFGGSFDNLAVSSSGLYGDLWEFSPAANEWTWVSGSCVANQPGIYASQGVASASNDPGARQGALSWTDSSGNFWLFGGFGYVGIGNVGFLNDLWEFSPSTSQWTWMGGSSTVNQPGVYGTLGVASTSTIPESRSGAVSWTDSSGNFWLFGGLEGVFSGSGRVPDLNDLWEFNPATKEWTWVSGSSAANQPGNYGAKGVASASNAPGARSGAVSWTDSSGNFWLYGGEGLDSTGTYGDLSDLWEFSTSTTQWTWVGGSNTANQQGVYGTMGSPAASNAPGARDSAVSWMDGSGNLWLFGGGGSAGFFNDLWRYQP